MQQEQNGPTKPLLNRGSLGSVVITLSVVSTLISPNPSINIWPPLLILAIGCSFHILVKGQLIRNTMLCTGGTYSVVRHPYYLGNFIIDSSLCLLSGNIYLMLLYPFLFFWACGPTIRNEEALLATKHRSEISAFRSAVPQVFPDPRSVRNYRNFFEDFYRSRITFNEVKKTFRFWSAAMLILLANDVRIKGLNELAFWNHPSDFNGMVFLAVFVLSFMASLFSSKKGKHRREANM